MYILKKLVVSIFMYMEDTKKRLGAPCLIHPAFVAELEEQCGKENVVVK